MVISTAGSILLVEDDPDDALAIAQAFESVGIVGSLSHVKDGEEAIAYLDGKGRYSQRQQPNLVLLDLQLPKISGLEVLQWLRKQPALRTVVVVIMAGLPLDCEIQRAYLFGANSLLVKGTTEEQLNKKVRLIKEYWLEANKAATSP